MVNYFGKARNRIRYYWCLYITKDPFVCAHRAWVKADGDHSLRQNYPLDSDSVVLDVGGYHGDWAEKIVTEFDSNVYVFEIGRASCRERV